MSDTIKPRLRAVVWEVTRSTTNDYLGTISVTTDGALAVYLTGKKIIVPPTSSGQRDFAAALALFAAELVSA